MYQFFVDDAQVAAGTVTIEGSDVNHIRNVLRMRPGEKVRVSAASGKNYFCSIAEISADVVRADIVSEDTVGTELPCEIYLFQGLPKSDKMELIIQKAVELGASHIIPVTMKNCVAKLDEKKAKAKTARWQEIAKSAAKQSKRSIIPEISAPLTYKQALEMAKDLDVNLLAYENERGMEATKAAVESVKPGDQVAIWVGPEGGFAPEEVELARAQGNVQIISLGRRILRTETAGLAALAILMYRLES